MKQYTFVVELDRCIGCKGCQVACKMENGTAFGSDRIKVRMVGPIGTYPELQMYFLPTMCQQCKNPICVRVCPTGAAYKNGEDGVICIDEKKCIGCHSCNKKCPYQANTYSETRRTMDKCTICAEARKNGETPACVRNCSGRALHYGDINDPTGEVYKLLKEAGREHVFHFQDFGNKPSARYILKNADWQDIMPQEMDLVSFGRGGRYYEHRHK